MKKLLLLFFLLSFAFKAHAKFDNYFSPGLTFGYTFHSGIRWGFFLDYGIYRSQSFNTTINYGLSYSLDWVYKTTVRDGGHHRLSSLNVMVESENFYCKVGFGLAVNPWGYGGNRNACSIGGINLDVSYTNRNQYMPWIGFKTLFYNKQDWVWFDYFYNSIYTKYKYDFNSSGLKDRTK